MLRMLLVGTFIMFHESIHDLWPIIKETNNFKKIFIIFPLISYKKEISQRFLLCIAFRCFVIFCILSLFCLMLSNTFFAVGELSKDEGRLWHHFLQLLNYAVIKGPSRKWMPKMHEIFAYENLLIHLVLHCKK